MKTAVRGSLTLRRGSSTLLTSPQTGGQRVGEGSLAHIPFWTSDQAVATQADLIYDDGSPDGYSPSIEIAPWTAALKRA